ncbi:MAG: threonine/serine dehydratase [Deltaproteobacteria bacterium]|nr:threonine/serine dehydratase [Deltaproteobacteria bacterium]
MPSAKTPDSLTVADVRAAATRIEGHVLRTPVLRRVVGGAELLCKAESLQPTGAFKLRGAFSLMTTLPPDSRGVIAHSSGNHAQAVAWAARALRLPAVIVMPNDAPVLKRARTEALGAEVITVGPDSDERARRAEELACERNLVLVPPYDHLLVAAGQGTAALELVEEAGPLQRFYAPVGGGGLMAGCSTVVAALHPDAEIVGIEPEEGDDTRRSLAAGERLSVPPPHTLADGLRVRRPGALTFPILRKHVTRIETVTDKELLAAMGWALTWLRLVLEPSGAASLAVALREAENHGSASPGGGPDTGTPRWGVLLSGGNVDQSMLASTAANCIS